MKDFFTRQLKEDVIEFSREYINARDIWYLVTIGNNGKEIKLRMHNNKEGIWRIMGNRIPYSLSKLEQYFSEAISKNEGPF